jgi:hypothetical protein
MSVDKESKTFETLVLGKKILGSKPVFLTKDQKVTSGQSVSVRHSVPAVLVHTRMATDSSCAL